MLIKRNCIKVNDKSYLVVRSLNSSTTEELASEIHKDLETETLLRDANGNWFCCYNINDAIIKDIDDVSNEESIVTEDTESDTKQKETKKIKKNLSAYTNNEHSSEGSVIDKHV